MNSFEFMMLGDGVNGLPEWLHMFGSQLYKMLLDIDLNFIGIGNQNKEVKDDLYKLYLAVVNVMKR